MVVVGRMYCVVCNTEMVPDGNGNWKCPNCGGSEGYLFGITLRNMGPIQKRR